MNSNSNAFQIIEDDDDEFDWEAAVLEIDRACSNLPPSEKPTSNPSELNCNVGVASNPSSSVHKKGNLNAGYASNPSTSKQSTLDRFIGNSRNGPLQEVEVDNNISYNDENVNGNEGVVGCEGVEAPNVFVKIDPEAAKTWIYPVNVPRRDYQFSITETALFSNTLVVLPTGLGKTLIAAVVMYNYFRWFPEGKIVFAAPSRPLVMQQIEACHNIVGIPQEWTIDLTGQTNPARRAGLWKKKRVFFVTPQVLEKDIQSGSCLVKYLVCLVIDEAHRAMGNYAYCVAVRELMDAPVQLRILALTATPGSKQQTIQQVINNLQISTLEHRSESDHDVLPYVHERKLELIEVAMGNEAVEVNNLLLEVIRPLVSRLSAFGVLPRRDAQTLSPCDFLTSRDRFRQEPPRDLPESKKGEIESHFTVLITLYHVKKLLSSHGIRPALEMLEEKLKQGYFARLVSRNEVLAKAKRLMQQTVSHGAPSPKLAKLLEVLTDHFNVKDPQNSRVIIFSNFRGSVRDIMDSLTNLGGFVKATEFIGQSSGKILKGQSQKVQQAVLQKFRSGGYNVIVATSIGEEGLDIMEVDLVICFDANISPLRMIQRMGRTGRKHEGRVVVLACEGSELKGYSRKQANSKTIKKHMHNGGMNSFNFHSSPRMIPHIYKPEVQLLELSIEEFVPRGKSHNDDNPIPVPAYKTKLTEAEKDLLGCYFAPGETSWKPSLIVFPHFQAYPSPVNKVAHSSRTGMLIDTMQYLQGLPFSNDHRTPSAKDEDMLNPYCRADTVEPCGRAVKDVDNLDYPDKEMLQTVEDSDTELEEITGTEDVHIEDLQEKPHSHTFLFDTEFVSVDDLGNVLVLSLSELHLNSQSKFFNGNNFTSHLMGNSSAHNKRSVDVEACVASQTGFQEGENVPTSILRNPGAIKGSVLPMPEKILETPVSNGHGTSVEDHHDVHGTAIIQMESEPIDEIGDPEFSPRLSNFVTSGVVPESPIENAGVVPESPIDNVGVVPESPINNAGCVPELPIDNAGFVPESPIDNAGVVRRKLCLPELPIDNAGVVRRKICLPESPIDMKAELPTNSWRHDEEKSQDGSLSKLDIASRSDEVAQAPEPCLVDGAKKECTPPVSVAKETQTPSTKLSNTSNSNDWLLDPGEDIVAVTQPCKFRRLRKHGNVSREVPPESNKLTDRNRNPRTRRAADNDFDDKFVRGKKKRANDAAVVYIEEEAEISSDSMASADEDEPESSSYEDSFIDDGANPTHSNTQAAASKPDMMAIYRRSLLSQSPFPRLHNISADFSPESVGQSSRLDVRGASSGTKDIQTPEVGLESTARNLQPTNYEIPSEPVEDENKLDSRKRKLSYYQEKAVPMVDLSKEFSFHCEATPKDSSMQMQAGKMEKGAFLDDDDDLFFEGIDFDAVEAEATKQLKLISEQATQKAATARPPVPTNLEFLGSPSFDLGF